MRRLLLINPNTSASVTALMLQHVQAAAAATAAGPAQVQAVTARFGAPYIACEASYAVAAHATLDAWAHALAAGAAPHAVLIGCFGDPGLFALRESSPVRVTGLAEAAFAEAAAHGRFAIVTGGERWKPMLERLAQALGHGPALAGIHTVQATGAELAADPAMAEAVLGQACRDAARETGAQAIILGGAGLAGLAARIQPGVPLPLIDSVLAGARHALAGGAGGRSAGGDGEGRDRPAAGFDVPWSGLSPAMSALGGRRAS